ncbi:hypothetical protein L873DRAFT_1768080 [Choiromyces venosus 120613-1]|uniref:THUMP domain-containing protein n=1 Tax=Choiromyces venosus 120613-1 TaxID=1336337 RepID=A0A3N4JM15_9PEZI|nr:hypothetical protein L873DRAFT_1768080 [Choiromyces venosus 120613-1]
MAGNKKRRSNNENLDPKSVKKNKTKEYWKNQAKAKYHSLHNIEEGSQGIFATCDRGREARCVEEMYRLLEQVASELYGLDLSDGKNDKDEDEDEDDEDEDIEASIQKEISGLKGAKAEKLFISVKLDIDCVVFFRLRPPCEPTAMVNALCAGTVEKRLKSRYVHRLTPVTRIGKANAEGLEAVAKEVLPPHFYQGEESIKFAIKPTSRNHNHLKRDQIIKIVADVVGTQHKADLRNPDLLILVDFYQASSPFFLLICYNSISCRIIYPCVPLLLGVFSGISLLITVSCLPRGNYYMYYIVHASSTIPLHVGCFHPSLPPFLPPSA